MSPAPNFVNVETAAEFLGVSKSCAYDAIHAGSFPVEVIRIGRRFKIPTAALHALAGQECPGPASVVDEGRGDLLAGDAA